MTSNQHLANKPEVKTEDAPVLANKQMVHGVGAQDGALTSPIDLVLDDSRPLNLDPLRWFNFDEPPFKMKITNSGDTLVVSAKWAKERPFLTGGPLDGNYVFSQAHFHWGSSEHEGSEHTVKGVCYPMEMHVVFFKTRYLTQAAALKHDDGVIIVAYLFKLQMQSCPGLSWLSGQLDHVVEPRSSTIVTPMPLSTFMVPFDSDYITYWGALVSQSCRHPVMWLVSRAALAVSSDDLNKFRKLLNSRKEVMTKNFRATSPSQGRAIFHINPSSEKTHLLLPGAVEPPCKTMIVNYSQTDPLNEIEAKQIFSKGDSNDLVPKDRSRSKKCKEEIQRSKTYLNQVRKTKIEKGRSIKDKPNVRNPSKNGPFKPNNLGMDDSLSPTDKNTVGQTKLQKQCNEAKKEQDKEVEKKPNNTIINVLEEQKGDCIHVNDSTSFMMASGEFLKMKQNDNGINHESIFKEMMESKLKVKDEKQSITSRLPVPTNKPKPGITGLQSCYATYFKRPDSAPVEIRPPCAVTAMKPTTPNPRMKPTILTPNLENSINRKVTTTIPKPSTKNGPRTVDSTVGNKTVVKNVEHAEYQKHTANSLIKPVH